MASHTSKPGRATLYIVMLMAISCDISSAFTMPAWSDIFSSLKPFENTESNPNSVRWQDIVGEDREFDELNLIEEGEPRYGLVQLGSGTSYNVTLNLTGHILLAIGIATSLLAYMFLTEMSNEESHGDSSSGYENRYGNYRSRRLLTKRSLEDDEKEKIQQIWRIVSSLSQEKVEGLLGVFENKLLNKENGTASIFFPDSRVGYEKRSISDPLDHFASHLDEKEEKKDSKYVGEDCINNLLCQMFLYNSSVSLSSSSDAFRKSRVMNLLLEAMTLAGVGNDINGVKHNDASMAALDSYSIYEWNDLIQIILGRQNHDHADHNNAIENNTLREKEENNVNVRQIFQNMHNNLNKIPSKLSNYFEIQKFANEIKENSISTSHSSLQNRCEDRYSRCELKTNSIP